MVQPSGDDPMQSDRRGFLGGLLASLAAPFVPKPTQPDAFATIRATANLMPWTGTGYTCAPPVSFSGGGGTVLDVACSGSSGTRLRSPVVVGGQPDPTWSERLVATPAIDPAHVYRIDTAYQQYSGHRRLWR